MTSKEFDPQRELSRFRQGWLLFQDMKKKQENIEKGLVFIMLVVLLFALSVGCVKRFYWQRKKSEQEKADRLDRGNLSTTNSVGSFVYKEVI